MLSHKSVLGKALAGTTLAALLLLGGRPAAAQKVYVGSGNGATQLGEHPEQWNYVRAHCDGFYVNFIEMLHRDAAKVKPIAAAFARKNVYFESDSRYTGLGGFPDGGQFSLALQGQEMSALLGGGFAVPYTSLNYGLDAAKQKQLQSIGLPAGTTRPCLTQVGPWTYGGDITTRPDIITDISHSDGVSTDGPLSLWQANQGKMREGSYSAVNYAHAQHKLAAVMVAPYNLKPVSKWLAAAQECVRAHEDHGARPDIWIVFEYATTTPVLPETADGKPADTTIGMAFWLLHHLQDPAHNAYLALPKPMQTAHANAVFAVGNHSRDMDYCPVVTAQVQDTHRDWRVRFSVAGHDVTRQITAGSGLPFVGPLRLWPGQQRRVQVAWTAAPGHHPAAGAAPPIVRLALRPNVSPEARVAQQETLRPQPAAVAEHSTKAVRTAALPAL